MVTDAQVRLLRQKRMDGKTQAGAAAASGMSLRTAREWDTGPAPSATKQPRDWRPRPDPFGAVWLTDVEPLLQNDSKGVLEAKLVLEVLRTRYPEQFHPGQARTLQRRVRGWGGGARGGGSGGGRSCGRAIRSSFTRGRRGPCSGGFATGGRGTASSPRCSSSKSPSLVARRR